MTGPRTTASLIGGVALLERALNYALGSLRLLTAVNLDRPTPCQDWDVRALLTHVGDSLLTLTEAVDGGRLDPDRPGRSDLGPDPAGTLRDRACRLLGAWAGIERADRIVVGGSPLTAGVVAAAGAVEVVVHGWDVAMACGWRRPIPPSLAEELLDLAPLLVSDVDRPARFAVPVRLPPTATPGDRLIAFLGRDPNPA